MGGLGSGGWSEKLYSNMPSHCNFCLYLRFSVFRAFLGIIILVGWLFPGIHVSSPFLGASLQPWFAKLAGIRAVWPLDLIFKIPILLIYF